MGRMYLVLVLEAPTGLCKCQTCVVPAVSEMKRTKVAVIASWVAVAAVVAFAGVARADEAVSGGASGRPGGKPPFHLDLDATACTAAQKAHNRAVLAAYRRRIAAERKAYFRKHQSLKAPAKVRSAAAFAGQAAAARRKMSGLGPAATTAAAAST